MWLSGEQQKGDFPISRLTSAERNQPFLCSSDPAIGINREYLITGQAPSSSYTVSINDNDPKAGGTTSQRGMITVLPLLITVEKGKLLDKNQA